MNAAENATGLGTVLISVHLNMCERDLSGHTRVRLAVSPEGTSCSPLLPYRCQLLPDALRAEVARLGGAEVEEAGRTAAVN